MSSKGAAVDSRTEQIHRAILENRPDEAIAILESDPSLVGACDLGGATPLHIAAWAHDVRTASWLLAHGAQVDAQSPLAVPVRTYQERKVSERTPLDYAAIVAGWSAHGRDFSLLENSRLSPERFDEMVRLLRSHGATLTPRAAVAIGDAQAVAQMHREGRLENDIQMLRGGLLSIAVRTNRPEMVALLLDLGLDPDERLDDEECPSWGMPLWFAAMCGRCEIAELLLRRGADVDAIVYACGDAMSIAETTGDAEMKALLLAHGARTTVEHVARSRDRALAQAILDGKVPARSLNVDDPSPADLAEQMLWAAGRSDPQIVRMCLPHVARTRSDPWWNYVLMHATLPESFRLVLEHGVDPDAAGDQGYTMLHHVATEAVDEQQRTSRATMLLDAGASLARRDALLRSTPLGWACRWGRADLVRLYLARGADPQEHDAEPWARPLTWAQRHGHTEIIELLREHGVIGT